MRGGLTSNVGCGLTSNVGGGLTSNVGCGLTSNVGCGLTSNVDGGLTINLRDGYNKQPRRCFDIILGRGFDTYSRRRFRPVISAALLTSYLGGGLTT